MAPLGINRVKDVKSVKADFAAQLKVAREKGLQDPKAMKKCKNDFKFNAFKTLPKEVFDRVLKKYKIDFDLFGYEDLRDKYSALYTSR